MMRGGVRVDNDRHSNVFGEDVNGDFASLIERHRGDLCGRHPEHVPQKHVALVVTERVKGLGEGVAKTIGTIGTIKGGDDPDCRRIPPTGVVADAIRHVTTPVLKRHDLPFA